MSTKHLYESADGLVLKSLRGAVALNPSLCLHEPSRTVFTPFHSSTKRVAVISGGGSGHEPAHAGYTGEGMLTASVAGDIFASPSAKQILSAIKLAACSGSESDSRAILTIINNYTGDRLNFGLAMEKARLAYPALKIDSVVVADDVSLLKQNASNKFVGPRGLGANILVCKILGALAEGGAALDVVKAYGDAVVANLFSLGVGLDHCHVPGRTKEGRTTLGDEECEVGLGLHNEPGVKKRTIDEPAELIDHMIRMLLDSQLLRNGASTLRDGNSGDGSVLFVNNLGGMSQLEMGAVVYDTVERLDGIHPRRVYCSSYMTSLNAPGFSISLLDHHYPELAKIDLYDLLDAPTDATSWWGSSMEYGPQRSSGMALAASPAGQLSSAVIETALRGACRSVLRVQSELTEFDTIVGDGDCGDTFAAGANGLDQGTLIVKGVTVSSIVNTMGGTIGALFAIFLNALSASLPSSSASEPIAWGTALNSARSTLSIYTPAQPGDRTLMDALAPFCDAMVAGETLKEAVRKAQGGAEKTKGMKASLGRAAYMSGKEGLPPDPGAWGVNAILQGILEGFLVKE
ncbi:Dak1 domain-containing protein [Gymnopilus junonius]|uniref:Dak1 domain-containing protein n=1 Tax=Gymnopilus junonius TaxID=109634 RepID=A0A9P5NA15_GYMJU|nr:Dak1 domain-containing protein [Gymnopilus junonius]